MAELLLSILKFAAILLTAVFGILTVLAENKEKSRLTKKGRIALAAALVSGGVAIVSQAVEFEVDRAKRQSVEISAPFDVPFAANGLSHLQWSVAAWLQAILQST